MPSAFAQLTAVNVALKTATLMTLEIPNQTTKLSSTSTLGYISSRLPRPLLRPYRSKRLKSLMSRFKPLLITLLLSSCSCSEPLSKSENYQLATSFRELAQTVDGLVKRGEISSADSSEIVAQLTQDYPNKMTPFAHYNLQVQRQEKNAVLLLCDKQVALMEDAGCNIALDKNYLARAQPAPATLPCRASTFATNR